LGGLREVPGNRGFRGSERELTYHDRRGKNSRGERASAGCAFACGLFACGRGAEALFNWLFARFAYSESAGFAFCEVLAR
jgi:hypothetical protein